MSFQTSGGLSVAIIGATGYVGSELAQRVTSILPVRELMLYATSKRAGDVIEVADRAISIKAFPAEGISPEAMSKLDVVFFTCPPALVRAHAETLSEDGIAVFDLTGALVDESGFSLAGVVNNDEAFAERRIGVLPSPVGAVLTRVSYALQGLGAWSLQASISVSASTFGAAGNEELSAQVSALFMGKESKKDIFPTGLAFDILPIVGQLQDDGTSSSERRVCLEVASMLGIDSQLVRPAINLAPIFCGIIANATIAFDSDAVDMDEITKELKESDGVSYHALPPSSKSIIGREEVFVGRIRRNPLCRGIDLWLCADNLSVAVHNALRLAKHYHTIGLI